MEKITSEILQYASKVIALIIIALIGYFGSKLLGKLKEKKNLENISLATDQVIKASQQTVLELQQTLVEGWKNSQDGKLTQEQVQELKDKVLKITMDKLSEPTLKLLDSAKIDVTVMITSAAESHVLALKEEWVL